MSTDSPTPSRSPSAPRNIPPLDRFLGRVSEALARATFVRLVLSHPEAGTKPVEKITARLIELQDEPVLSLTLREPQRDQTRNLKPDEAVAWLRSELGPRFRSGLIETTTGDWQLNLPADNRPARLVRHAPRVRETPARDHDRSKSRALEPSSNDWLHGLGLTDPAGHPLPSRTDKHQQIHRYAEILGHLVRDCGWSAGGSLRVADMGCGRGYLTFAAWQLLRRQLGFDVKITGIEARPALVEQSRELATRLGFEGLTFAAGTVAETAIEPLDALLALHACNTATDDAIQHGIAAGCRLIVVAPCCHQEVRPQLSAPEPFTGALAHGIVAERFAEWITDVLRIHFLEWAGYQVKTVEFVAPEHTPRNLLIAGILGGKPFTDAAVRDRIVALKSMFGIGHHGLDPLLGR